MSLGMMGLILVSCKSVAQQNPAASTSVAESPPQAKKEVRPLAGPQPKSNPAITGIAPNRCRIIGKIVAVSSERDKDNTSVCGKAPCKAIVKIQQVIGYGHAFTQTLAANQEINTYFTFSLSPTAKLFPDMTTPLPGLAIGSIFEADVAYNSEVAGDVAPWYQVGVYRLAR
ncbi:MAG: hypothetical protein AVDCRST_MAG95-2280 [uncultured Adhaeribacter sp.]|uniref:Uncharacterized protein n=1 Tax=uncultured Adhaeribacter sp. TaxID=448109 RepID=A0A6J4ITE4_9BACT|nr:MAG: hypothetical protein AVDCRST_MAG95-2280 [uncultured Adhaeribacter sp.]